MLQVLFVSPPYSPPSHSKNPTPKLTPTARWKLSTRERKKSLEDSLKNSDYSEHHLIPVYGFRRGNEDAVESEGDGGEGSNGGGGGASGAEERRMELRRLEGRALAAERMSLERRSRAEGGPGGAAFARAMCRRATARAEWIQKVGQERSQHWTEFSCACINRKENQQCS